MKNQLVLLSILGFSFGPPLMAGDVYHRVPFGELPRPENQPPSSPESGGRSLSWALVSAMWPYAVADDPAAGTEILLDVGESPSPWVRVEPSFVVVRSPEGKEVKGKIFLPKADLSGMETIAFSLSPKAEKTDAREFHRIRENHCRARLSADLPGAAWFRHEMREALLAQGKNPADLPSETNPPGIARPGRELEDTLQLFSGGRAVSENLQLERLMNLRTSGSSGMVPLASLKGIETKAMDWKSIMKGPAPSTDPLAARIPADQHALFFPGFEAMGRMLDEAELRGTPLLRLFLDAPAEDAGTSARCQRQLCLGLNEISRLLGPELIDSVAFTGSDPYLRAGSDVAVLFESRQPAVLQTVISARQALAKQSGSLTKSVSGAVGDVSWTGVVSPDRSICSYVATIGGTVVVSNSLSQISRLADAAAGKIPSLSSLEEYAFFRQRYARTDKDESAFLILSDATIRRWCSPRWRIADSRRTLAAGLMSELTAAHLPELVNARTTGAMLDHGFKSFDAGPVTLTSSGPLSATYGSLNFMTPISELAFDSVTQAEADAYNRWREGYEHNWSQFFDPIAIRFSVSPQKIGVEITVMPLIAGSEYHQVIAISSGAAIAPGAGDPHHALLHWAAAFNAQSEPVLSMGRSLSPMMPSLTANPLGWVGQSISLFLDEDPFWDRLAKDENPSRFLQQNYADLPIGLNAAVAKPLELTLFLTSLRGMMEQSAPGLTTWANLEHNGSPYVKISARPGAGAGGYGDKLTLYYAATPGSLLVTLNEDLLKRALDRDKARSQPGYQAPAGERPWLGNSHSLQADSKVLGLARKLSLDSWRSQLQSLSWRNLPILNEWKRLYPDKDPVALHEEFFGVRLVDPAGGTYTWNQTWGTMESSACGHPGQQKIPEVTAGFMDFTAINLGLNFEPNGLSAKAIVERAAK